MIRGIHGMFYSSQAEEVRTFLRDKLQIPHKDVGGGWLVFDFPEADMGVHPVDFEGAPPSGTHDISFYCDDLDETVAGMRERGVEFATEVSEQEYGRIIHFIMPGGMKVQLYQPKYK